jgi:demethylmenaquinone methyltransferase / 2-methoxy-6-polyprenyl-1,4-benzoquinol methylase
VSNVFYAPGEQRAAKVNDLFAAIARRYDLLNDLQSFGLHRRWKRRVVRTRRRANRRPRARFVLRHRRHRLRARPARRGNHRPRFQPANARSGAARHWKLEVKIPQSAIRNPQFIQGDAQQIPFPDNSFDIVTVGYGCGT